MHDELLVQDTRQNLHIEVWRVLALVKQLLDVGQSPC